MSQTIMDTIRQLKLLGVTKATFGAMGEITSIEMVNEKVRPEISDFEFKKAIAELEEETLYYSAN